MPAWPFSKVSSIGLDIRTNEIRWLHLRHSRRNHVIEGFGIIPWPYSLGEAGCWEALSSLLASLVAHYRLQQLPTVIALPLSAVFIKHIQLSPDFTADELQAEAHARIQRDLVGIEQEISIDFAVTHADEFSKNMLVAATKTDYLSQYLAAINKSGLQVKVVDVDAYVLAYAAYTLLALPLNIPDAIAVLDIHRNVFTLVVFQCDDILFSHSGEIVQTGNSYTTIKQVLQLYATTCKHAPLKQILLCGNRDQLTVLDDYIVDEFSLHVQWADTFLQLPLASSLDSLGWETMSSHFLACYGLAIRKLSSW
ncbi:MAG: hypothetical protein A3J38_02255 [Gammaproteobacteria bacterium RIFCSPHIGHO2_12_FULL_45_9]|nr:MAG: hypothetical protein A3J38_02255 [Gammaproteobacteria bacterium RIFCSPHIGHO2_12_FULL_45_9]